MKYARLLLKWITTHRAILILLNGAYIGFKGFEVKDVEFIVKRRMGHSQGMVPLFIRCISAQHQRDSVFGGKLENAASKYRVDRVYNTAGKVGQIQGLEQLSMAHLLYF